jgi:DNA-binding CsgD family transcriptional regulator
VARQGLIGREAELSRLDACMADAENGAGHLVLLSGEPGIGKTRLASAATERARARGFVTAWGSCRETAGAPPYWPWTQLLRTLLGTEVAAAGRLATLVDPEGARSLETDRFRLFDTVGRELADVAASRPLLLVLDDLHRADEASILLLRFVLPTIRDHALILLGTYRDTEVPAGHSLASVVGEVAGDLIFELIALRGLGRNDTARLVRGASHAATDDEVAAMHARTGGNPFFLTEVLQLGADGGASIPPTVEAAIRARLSDLPPSTGEMLQLAAVIGREVKTELLAAIAERPADVVVAALTPAVERGLLAPHHDHPADYRFGHVLVQQTLYALIPADRRVAVHDRITDQLQQLVGDDPAYAVDLAHHSAEALGNPGRQARAFALARRAADSASDRLADEAAASWYERALALGPPAEDQVPLLLALGRAAGRAGHVAKARIAFDQAWTVASRRGRTSEQAHAALGLGEVIVSVGTVDAGLVRMLERTLARLAPEEQTLRARLTARLATELYWSAELDRARTLAAAAVASARQLADEGTLAAALASQQFVLRGPDHLPERIAIGNELRQIATRLDDESLELQALRFLFPDQLQDNLIAADMELQALEALAESSRRPRARWYLSLYRAIRATMSGRSDEAAQLIDAAEVLGCRLGAQPARIYAAGQRFALLRQLGRVGETEDELRREASRWPVLAVFRCMLALLLADLSRSEEATALLDELVPNDCAAVPKDSLRLASVAILAEAAAELEHEPHAATLHLMLEPYGGRVAQLGVVVWWGAVDQALAMVSTTLRRWDEADARFRTSLQLHEAWSASPWVTATLTAHAAMLRRRAKPGDRERAARMTAQATRMTAKPPSLSGRRSSAALTGREGQILDLLAAGSSNKEIARRLGLSVHTVERHIANVYTKIGVRNRAEATAYSIRAASP